MLFVFVEMVYIRIIKGTLMKISKHLWQINYHLSPQSNHPCKQLLFNGPKLFKSPTDSVFLIIKDGPGMKQNIELKMKVAWTIELFNIKDNSNHSSD